MDKNIRNIMSGVVSVAMASLLWSCAAETPWDDEGTGTILLHTTINNATTRAVEGYTDQELAENCVVYISRKNGITTGDSKTKDGLVYKEKGLSNVKDKITLNAGKYAAEAWTGDSAGASFDKKYFRAYTDFEVTKNAVINVTLNCKIQNTIVMIDNTGLSEIPMQDYSITVTSSAGSQLVFKPSATESENTIIKKGYFMMPEDASGSFTYTISGTKKLDGTSFSLTGKIENVKRTTAYVLTFSYNPPTQDPTGGASFINVEVDETEGDGGTENETIPAAAPAITGVGFTDEVDLSQLATIPEDIAVKVCAIDGFNTATVESASFGATTTYNLLGSLPTFIGWSASEADENKVVTAYMLLKKEFLSGLAAGTHTFTVTVTDKKNKEGTYIFTIKK